MSLFDMSKPFENVFDGLCDSTKPDTEAKGRAQPPVS